jgi:hypothetical protein
MTEEDGLINIISEGVLEHTAAIARPMWYDAQEGLTRAA